MLELAILGLLKELPLHGYELKKRLNDTLGHVWGVSYGSLYPALKRLEREGAVEPVFAKDDVAYVLFFDGEGKLQDYALAPERQ